jgi:hypothetical protein
MSPSRGKSEGRPLVLHQAAAKRRPNIATYRSTLIMRVVKHTTVLPL